MMRTILTAALLTTGVAAPAAAALGTTPRATFGAPLAASAGTAGVEVASIRCPGRTGGFGS